MNEKRNIEPALDPDSPETRTRSDVAPKQKQESGAPARHISGLRPAVHLPTAPSVPPAPLTPADLLEDGWDDQEEEDSGPTLLDPHGSVPRELVAEVRALRDPLGEREPETREVSTREVETRSFSRDEAPTGEMPTMLNALPPPPPAQVADVADVEEVEDEGDDEFSHDDFPTRQTPMGLQEALLSYPLPSDSHRGLHETTLDTDSDSTPDLPSSPSFGDSLGPTVARPVAPVSPRAMSLPSPVPMMATSPDETAQMPNRPALMSPLPPPVESSSISQISQLSQISHSSYPSLREYPASTPRGAMYPTPTSITGAPLPPANTVRFAFLKNVSPYNDPPPSKLLFVAAISFFATLVLSSFIAWIVVLVRH